MEHGLCYSQYTDLFLKGEGPMDAARWDRSAGDYQRVFREGCNGYNRRLLDFMLDSGILYPGCKVLDVGCGVGKYGTYFAAMGCDVTLTDISGEMLRRAEENMRPYASPWRTVAGDFETMEPSLLAPSGPFDLAISTMSPAVHDLATVKKLSALTRGWCLLTNFVSWRQPLRDRFYRALAYDPVRSMAGGLDSPEALEKAVEQAGYEPHIRYENYDWADERSPQEAAAYLIRRHPAMDEEDPELFRRAVETAAGLCDEKGIFQDRVFTRVAWLSWKTLKED